MMSKDESLLKLQKMFETGRIKEENLKEEEKNKLIELYKMQIEELHQDTNNYKKIFQEYKEKTITIRKKLTQKNW